MRWQTVVDPSGQGGAGGTPTGTATGTPTGSPTGTPTGSPTGTPTGTSTGTPTGTTTGCDLGDCTTCVGTDCATERCFDELDACVMSQACIDLNTCYGNCQDDFDCFAQCDAQYPDGVATFYALGNCLLCTPETCAQDCSGSAIALWFCYE